MTRWVVSRISAGWPSAILLAEVEHGDAVAHAHDEAHVVLDEQHGVALDRGCVRIRPPSVSLLGRVEAGGRLVEQQQLRLGRHRPGDLEPALVAVGQVAGGVVGAVARCRRTRAARIARSRPVALLAARCRGSRGARRARSSGGGRRRRPCTFSSARHLREQPDVLECAGDAGLRDLVALAAPRSTAPSNRTVARRSGCTRR